MNDVTSRFADVIRAARLTDAIKNELLKSRASEFTYDGTIDMVREAMQGVDKNCCLMTKLNALFMRAFLFGYAESLEDFSDIQPIIMGEAVRGTLEDDDEDEIDDAEWEAIVDDLCAEIRALTSRPTGCTMGRRGC